MMLTRRDDFWLLLIAAAGAVSRGALRYPAGPCVWPAVWLLFAKMAGFRRTPTLVL